MVKFIKGFQKKTYKQELCFSISASSLASLSSDLGYKDNKTTSLDFGPSLSEGVPVSNLANSSVFLDSRSFYRVHGPAAFRSSVISPNLDVPNTYNYTILLFWFFFFSSCITIFFLVYFFTAVSQNTELRRPVRETKGFSRAQVGDAMTAVIPLTWSISMLMHASLFSTNFDDNVAATAFSFTVIAYQWGWNYYFPKDITTFADYSPILVGRGRIAQQDTTNGYESLLAKTKDEYLARMTSQGAYVNPTSKFTVSQLFDLFLRSSQPSFSSTLPQTTLSLTINPFFIKEGQLSWLSLFSRLSKNQTLDAHKDLTLSGFPSRHRSFSGIEGLQKKSSQTFLPISNAMYANLQVSLKNMAFTKTLPSLLVNKLKILNLTQNPQSSLHPWGQRTKKNLVITSNRLTLIYKVFSSSKYSFFSLNTCPSQASYMRSLINSDKSLISGSLQNQEPVVQPIQSVNFVFNLNQVPGPWNKKSPITWVSTQPNTYLSNDVVTWHKKTNDKLNPLFSIFEKVWQPTTPLHTPYLNYLDDLDVSFYNTVKSLNLEKISFVSFYRFTEKFSLLWKTGFPQHTDLGLGNKASLVSTLADLNSGININDLNSSLNLNLKPSKSKTMLTEFLKPDLILPFFIKNIAQYPLEQRLKWSLTPRDLSLNLTSSVFPWLQSQLLYKKFSYLSQGPCLYSIFGLSQDTKNFLSFLSVDSTGLHGSYHQSIIDTNVGDYNLSCQTITKAETNLKTLHGLPSFSKIKNVNLVTRASGWTIKTKSAKFGPVLMYLPLHSHTNMTTSGPDALFEGGFTHNRQFKTGFAFSLLPSKFLVNQSNFQYFQGFPTFFSNGVSTFFKNKSQLFPDFYYPSANWLNAEDRKKIKTFKNLELFDPLIPSIPAISQSITYPIMGQPNIFVWRWSWAPQAMCSNLPIENFFRGSVIRRPTKGFWEQSMSNERALYTNALAFAKKRFDKASLDMLISKSKIIKNGTVFGELGLPVLNSAKRSVADVPLCLLPSPHLDLDFMFLFSKWSFPLNASKRENHDSRFKVLWGPLFAAYNVDFNPFTLKTNQDPVPTNMFSGPSVPKSLSTWLVSNLSLTNQLRLNDNYSDLGLGLKKNTIKFLPLLQGTKGYTYTILSKNEKVGFQALHLTNNLKFSFFWSDYFNFSICNSSWQPPFNSKVNLNKWSLLWLFDFGPNFRTQRGRYDVLFATKQSFLFTGLKQRRLDYCKASLLSWDKTSQVRNFSEIEAMLKPDSKSLNTQNFKRSGFVPLSEELHQSRRLRVTKGVFLPTDIPMHGIFGSKDVVHSWAIPGLHIKIDCIPGYSSQRRIYINTRGLFWGQCMEVCGRYHHWMPILIRTGHLDLFLWWCAHHLSGLERSFLTSSQPLISPELSSSWVWSLVTNSKKNKSFFFEHIPTF